MSLVIDGELFVLVSDGTATEIFEERDDDQVIEVVVPGAQGPPGEPGPSGLEGFNFTQSSASATWTIAHNLGYRPVVQAYTTGGARIWGAELHLSANVVQVTFNTAFAGTARCV